MKWGKRENYLRQVLGRVIETLGSPVGWNTLRQNTDIASHNTIADYVDALKDSFILIYLHQFDISRKTILPEGEEDSLPRSLLLACTKRLDFRKRPLHGESLVPKRCENVRRLVEGIVADHLVRLAFLLSRQKQLFEYENALFFWRGKKERGVDFVLRMDGTYLPSKSSINAASREAVSME